MGEKRRGQRSWSKKLVVGGIGRSFGTSDATAFTMVYYQWTEPRKVFGIGAEVAGPGLNNYHRGMFALDAKTFTEDWTPLKAVGAAYAFRWEDNGFPNSPTTVLEPASGHVFALMSGVGSNVVLSATNTLIQQTNTKVKDGYVVELDAQMKVVRKVRLTNLTNLLGERVAAGGVVGLRCFACAAGDVFPDGAGSGGGGFAGVLEVGAVGAG